MSRKRQKTTRSLVSIIIPVYGRFDLLEKCLNSIPDIPDYHIVLVDDNSPEENKDEFYLSINREQHVTFIRNKENKGFAATCNIGADRSRSPLLFFLNTDVILHENAIDHLVREMDEPSTGICGMKLLFPEFPEGVPQEGRPPGKIQHIGMHLNINAIPTHSFSGWSPDNPKVLKMREVWAVTGAAFMIRKSVFRKARGFDERYGKGTFEDIDLCMKVKDLGYNIIVSQEAVGDHHTNASVLYYRVGFPVQRNQIDFISKWADKLFWTGWEVW